MPLDIRVLQTDFSTWDTHRADPRFEARPFATSQFLADTVGQGTVRYLSHPKFKLPVIIPTRSNTVLGDEVYPISTTGILVQAAHACFATHQGFGLNPDVIWQTIVGQVATHIKLNPSQYTHLFTESLSGKVNIVVRDNELPTDNNWQRALGMFESPLRLAIGDELVSLLTPTFTTTAQIDRVASLVTLMDAASPFYNYTVASTCRIPLIRLEGDAIDWRQLYERTGLLAEKFTGLDAYFTDLLPVLHKIFKTVEDGRADNDFWDSIYKFRSTSGTDRITGWITSLMAFRHSPQGPVLRKSFNWRYDTLKTNEIPSLLSTITFAWQIGSNTLPMILVAGVLGIDQTDGIFTPRLGVAVMER